MAVDRPLRLYAVDMGETDWVAAHNPVEALAIARKDGCNASETMPDEDAEYISVREVPQGKAEATGIDNEGWSTTLWAMFQAAKGPEILVSSIY